MNSSPGTFTVVVAHQSLRRAKIHTRSVASYPIQLPRQLAPRFLPETWKQAVEWRKLWREAVMKTTVPPDPHRSIFSRHDWVVCVVALWCWWWWVQGMKYTAQFKHWLQAEVLGIWKQDIYRIGLNLRKYCAPQKCWPWTKYHEEKNWTLRSWAVFQKKKKNWCFSQSLISWPWFWRRAKIWDSDEVNVTTILDFALRILQNTDSRVHSYMFSLGTCVCCLFESG